MSDKLTELLPWYVNGTLNTLDREWVDEYLKSHPEARGELEWYQTLQRQIHEITPEVSPDIGLSRAMARIESEKAEIARAETARASTMQAAPARREPVKAGMVERMRDWFANLSSSALKPALGVALAVVAVQSVVLVNALNDDDASHYRAIPPGATAQGPVIKINFKSEATEADMRLLMVEIDGTMAGGPGQLGDWYVRVPADRIDAALAKVKASKFVDAGTVLDAVPARP